MVEQDFGEATIAYEDPDGETVEETVQNEHVAYFQDHWILRIDEDEQGRDRVRRIPTQRVYYVERTVEEFEEVKTVRDQVQSVADDLRSKLLGGSETRGGGGLGGGRGTGSDEGGTGEPEVHHIDVESGESVTDREPGSGSNGESSSDGESGTDTDDSER
ncbi:hypothetical protein [Halorussus litoreus]|uniref:hypothetical protein n=1 Tax=Halorussus litoreus TaxID=1710536 RepID=UPI000E268BCD|nr:hypothetical protein [Halorussus litoreus]